MTSKKSHIELQDITGSNKSSDREGLLHYNTKNDSKISEVKAEPEQTKYYLDSSHYRHSIQTTNENESLPFPKLFKNILPQIQKLPQR